MKPSLPTFALQLTLLAYASCAGAKVLQHWDFDEQNPFHNLVIQGDRPELIDDPQNPGNKVMRSILRPNTKRPERSEVMPGVITVGDERWIGARIMRPDQVQSGFNCFFQLGPIDGAKDHGGGGLYQLNAYDKSTWTFRAFLERVGGKGLFIKAGPINYGKWDTWVFHIKLRADKDGLIEVWRNKTLVTKNAGQNAFPGDRMRIKWGVYVGKGGHVPADISACYDDISIGDETSSYEEVLPKPHK